MSKTVALSVICACNKKKEFTHSLEVEEAKDRSVIFSKTIDCPFIYEKNCMRHISIKLPPGMQAKEDRTTLRN